MTPAQKRKRHRTARKDKVAWLRERPEMRTLPMWDVAQMMLESGLYSKNTRLLDVNVKRLLKEAQS